MRPRNYYIYELKGIVVHCGTAFAGHYYSYVKERPRVNANGVVRRGGGGAGDRGACVCGGGVGGGLLARTQVAWCAGGRWRQ